MWPRKTIVAAKTSGSAKVASSEKTQNSATGQARNSGSVLSTCSGTGQKPSPEHRGDDDSVQALASASMAQSLETIADHVVDTEHHCVVSDHVVSSTTLHLPQAKVRRNTGHEWKSHPLITGERSPQVRPP